MKSVTNEDIKATLFDVGNDNSPGPNGYSSAFCKTQWDKIGEEVIQAVKEFFTTGQLLKNLNTTVVSLIPKTTTNLAIGDFRPILVTM